MKALVLALARKKRLTGVAVGLLALLICGSAALATIPSSGGVISGCYLRVGGVLRVIDTARNQQCIPNLEVPISWNQAGTQGPKGDPGSQGPKGDPGPEGPPGPAASLDVVMTSAARINVPEGTYEESTAMCPDGRVSTGGGFVAYPNVRVVHSFLTDDGRGWTVVGLGESGGNPYRWFAAYAVCAKV
jgi:hypothetical protein